MIGEKMDHADLKLISNVTQSWRSELHQEPTAHTMKPVILPLNTFTVEVIKVRHGEGVSYEMSVMLVIYMQATDTPTHVVTDMAGNTIQLGTVHVKKPTSLRIQGRLHHTRLKLDVWEKATGLRLSTINDQLTTSVYIEGMVQHMWIVSRCDNALNHMQV